MKKRIHGAALALVVNVTAATFAPRVQTKGAAQTGAVVFAVSKYESSVNLELAFIYRGGTFVKPPIDEEAGSRAFTRDYFRAGRKYRLLSGGGDAGTVTVKQSLEQGCVSLVAEGTAETEVRLGGHVQALATDSQTIGRAPSSRRAPNEAERARALELARASFVKNGVAASLASKTQVVNLTATDLDRDGEFELIGSFLVEKKDASKPDAFTLFLIIEPAGGSFKTAWEWFHHGVEGDFADREYIDQIDLDGDGVGEVVAAGGYYESNDYIVYKRQQGRWRPVYQGGGGGC